MPGVLFTILFTAPLAGFLVVRLRALRIQAELGERTCQVRPFRTRPARIPRFFTVTEPVALRVGPLDDALARELRHAEDGEAAERSD